MKKLATFLLAGVLSASLLSASEVTTQQNVSSVQSQDLEFLFGANANDVNVVALSEKELKETRGEFWGAFWGTVVVETIDRIGENNGWW